MGRRRGGGYVQGPPESARLAVAIRISNIQLRLYGPADSGKIQTDPDFWKHTRQPGRHHVANAASLQPASDQAWPGLASWIRSAADTILAF